MGKTNPLSVLLFLVLVVAGWAGFLYVPLYLDHLDVRESAVQIINLVPTAGEPERAIDGPLLRLNSQIGWHYGIDEETGDEKVMPGLGLTKDDNIQLVVDAQAKKVSCRISYNRVITLVPFKQRRTFHFETESSERLQ